MSRRHRRSPRSIAVKFTDAATGRSLSFTVYASDHAKALSEVARHGQAMLRVRFSTTSLNDRRHKRRV